MTGRAWPISAVSGSPQYAARHGRQTSVAPFLAGGTAARPLGATSGVRPGTPSTTVAVSGSTWTVHPHGGILDVETASEAGPYGYAFDADETGTISPAHATLTRWDGIYVVLDDPAEDDSTIPACRIEYKAGTTTPALPTAPARSIRLARLVVPPSGGGSASVVWDPPVMAAAGGMYVNPTAAQQADLNAIATASSPALILDGSTLKRSVGSGFGGLTTSRSRVLTPALSGTVGTNDLVADQTIPANLFSGVTKAELRVSASIQCLIAAAGGVRLEIVLDGVAVKTATFGNGASGVQNMAVTCDLITQVSAGSSHTVRARVVNVAGANSVSADAGQSFSMSVQPTEDL